MKAWKWMMAGWVLLGLATGFASAAVTVTNVTVQQRWPWNGLVDIDYTVVCDDADADVYVYPTGYDHDLNSTIAMRNLSGEGASAPVKPGTHRMTWDLGTDKTNFHSSAFSVKMNAVSGAAPYLVVDLSGGSTATNYPVSYLAAPPGGTWTDEYKGSNLVLRLILPGTYTMGCETNELGYYSGYDAMPHAVTISEPFYIGVFEVTQKQWFNVMGVSNTSSSSYRGNYRPACYVSYNTIRGATLGANWPAHNQVDATSFLGVLRTKAGLTFDLPTEAQWEYACRAGTTTALNSGKDLTGTGTCPNMAEVGRYSGNQSDGKGGYTSYHTTVGSYLPNAWGLYDMHGNVWEWCLDWYQSRSSLGSAAATDPVGAASGSYRLVRGGGYGIDARNCRSAVRNYNGPSDDNIDYGFRLVALPAVQ